MRHRSVKVLATVVAACWGVTSGATVLAQPSNDICTTALPLTLGVPANGTTVDAAADFGVTCAPGDADVWYSFTPATTGPYRVSVSGKSGPSLSLAILSGCEFPIAEMACVVGTKKGASLETTLWEGSPIVIRVGSTVGQAFTVAIENAPPPANDECEGAIPLTLGVPLPTNNLAATTTLELDNQSLCSSFAPGLAGGADVFFAFTPDQDGYYNFSTCGSDIDTVISVHSACGVTAANAIACNDNAPLNACSNSFDTFSSFVSGVQLTSGQTYYIRVAGVRIFNPFTGELEGPGRGRFDIVASFGVAPVYPANDTCDNAEVIAPNASVFGSTINATSDRLSTCGVDDAWDVWYQFTSPETERTSFMFNIASGSFNAQATLSVFGDCDEEPLYCQMFNPFSNPDMTIWVGIDAGQTVWVRVAGQSATQDNFIFTTATGGPAASNVSCETAEFVTAGETVVADTTGASSGVAGPCGFADIYPLWYAFTATEAGYYRVATDFPFDPESSDRTTLTVYRDCGEEAIACTSQGDQFSTHPRAGAMAVHLDAGETIYSRVSYESPVRAAMDFSVTGPLAPPPVVANDTCATAHPIGAMPFTTSVDITLATQDQDVCVALGQPEAPTPGGIWFTYTPAVENVFRGSGTVVSTGENLRISVFEGSCGGLTQVGCPENSFPGGPGMVLSAGTTYFILASLLSAPGEPISEIPYGTTVEVSFVSLPRPANDHCNTAARITSTSSTITINTLSADADPPAPSCIGLNGVLENAVWYTFTPSTSGTVSVEGIGTSNTEFLYSPGGVLYSGSCSGLTEVACDSPRNGFFITRQFEFTAELEAGVTYYLAVGSYARAEGGETEITFEYTGELGCAADFNADGQVNSQDFFDFLTAFFASAPTADFNDDGLVNSQDFFDFLTTFFAGCN